MVLELFTASGALVGGLVAFLLSDRVLAALFAALLAWVAVSMIRAGARAKQAAAATSAAPAEVEIVDPESFTGSLGGDGYTVRRLPMGMAGSVFAGLVSAILGVGGGIVKVPVMNLVMGVPLKVATATSNMMIGITATSSAVIYLLRGQIDPYVAGPTALGVFVGAMVGSRIAARIDVRLLRWLFVIVLVYNAIQMGLKALAA
jgi:uncharacterized membrane protein YfcA